jgi:hypothetical protein
MMIVMKKIFVTTFILALLLPVGIFCFSSPAQASGSVCPDSLCLLKDVKCATRGTTGKLSGASAYSGSFEVAETCTLCDAVHVLVNASNLIVAISGALAVLMFVYAGLMMIMSYVKPAYIAQAKETIKYAIIGLAIIFGGYTVINFSLMALGGETNMGPLAGAYKTVTGKDVGSWGVCQEPTAK